MWLIKLLPAFIKGPIAAHIRSVVDGEQYRLPSPLYLQSHVREQSYCIKRSSANGNAEHPIPPKDLWWGYGEDAQSYLSSGKADVDNMVQILNRGGLSIVNSKRILEFGCAAARMLRHVPLFAPNAELWGVDISASHVQWCVANLTPPMHFANTTTIPHLPFEDRYFDLVFCGSVFTHIEEFQQSWLLELARVLQPMGKLFITIHDENTVRLLDTSHQDNWLAKHMPEWPLYAANKDDFDLIVIGRGTSSQVFCDSGYLKSTLPPCLRWVSHTPQAYGYQSAVLLEKSLID